VRTRDPKYFHSWIDSDAKVITSPGTSYIREARPRQPLIPSKNLKPINAEATDWGLLWYEGAVLLLGDDPSALDNFCLRADPPGRRVAGCRPAAADRRFLNRGNRQTTLSGPLSRWAVRRGYLPAGGGREPRSSDTTRVREARGPIRRLSVVPVATPPERLVSLAFAESRRLELRRSDKISTTPTSPALTSSTMATQLSNSAGRGRRHF